MIKTNTPQIAAEAAKKDLQKGLLLLQNIEVEEFKPTKGFVELKTFYTFRNINMTGVNILRLHNIVKKECHYNRYFNNKYSAIKFTIEDLFAFFEKYDNAALVNMTKKLVKTKRVVETNMDKIKKDVLQKLNTGVTKFIYQRKNGSIRIATGTINNAFVPEFARIEKNMNHPDDNLIHYFDLTKNAYRSFIPVLFIGLIQAPLNHTNKSCGLTEEDDFAAITQTITRKDKFKALNIN